MANILILYKNEIEAQLIAETIEDNLHESIGNVYCTQRLNTVAALNQVRRRQFDLIIVGSQVPKAKKSKDTINGIEFLKEVFDTGKRIPSILILDLITNELYEASCELYKCRIVALGENFEPGLLKACRTLLNRGPRQIYNTTKNAIVDITLEMDKNDCLFKIQGQFGDSTYSAEGILEINRKKLQDLIHDSRLIKKINPWECEFQKIGKTLVEEIFRNNYIFAKHFYRIETKIGDREKIKFRFHTKRPLHPLLLEAMFEEEENQYWMLRSPIYRKLNVSGEYQKMVFNQADRSEEINCLIIESDASGDLPKLKTSFQKLNNITIESSHLYELLNNNRELYHVDKIEVIDNQDASVSFVDKVKDKLCNNHWHLVHFAGHSYYDSQSQKGWVIFPDKNHPIAREIKEFGQWLRIAKTQLVFLSSCNSSSEYFVFELANNGVPAIIGFRWDLDDLRAAEYTNKFYNHIFIEKDMLEHAFLKTRQEMYRDHRRDRIWASPMLVMQC